MPTILLVDDTPANLGVVVETLEDRGYRVLIAQDGEEGLQRAAFVKPELILLDVMLPGIDGFEVCRRLKSDNATADIPVIFLTSLAETEHMVAGFQAGGVDYVTKPIQIEELAARVGTHLNLRAMRRQLLSQNVELWTHRVELEQRVEQRTAELLAANRRLRAEAEERKQIQERLAQVDFALDHVSEAAYLIDENGRFRHVNAEACRSLGFSREALLDMVVADIDPDWPRERWPETWQELEREGRLTLETRHRHRDGRIFPVEVKACHFVYQGVGYSLSMVRDITESKRHQAREETHRRIFEQIAQGGELADILGLVVDYVEQLMPDSLASIMLLDAEGKHLQSVASSSLPKDYAAAVDGIAVGDGVGSCGTTVWRGETIIVEDVRTHPYWVNYRHLAIQAGLVSCWSEPIFDSAGAVLGSFGMYSRQARIPNDEELRLLRRASHYAAIAIERRRMEARLRASEREYRALAENSPEIIVRYDRDCRRVYINPAYERETGIPLGSAWHKTPVEVSKSAPRGEETMARLKQVMATGQSDRFLIEWEGKDGRTVSHDMHAVAEYDEHGQVAGVLVIGHNVTELKATERRLEESRAQLRALAAKREEAREEERKRIAREIHDELGQLLNVLRLNVTTLDFRFGEADPGLREKLLNMVSTVDRAIQMVRSLTTKLRPAVLSAGIVSALEWVMQEYAQSTGIDCHLLVSDEEIPLGEDRAIMVFRIVQESLTNVLRHSGASRVEIVLHRVGEVCELEVRDNGKGFDPDSAGRADSYGIAGMRERALILQGELHIAKAETGGTVLTVRFPMN
ncbi:MAG: PAS domain S-box protein [Methylococcaceae bacterium]|nr:PAS domain S-box protein [Methylococcaceae bacterium]